MDSMELEREKGKLLSLVGGALSGADQGLRFNLRPHIANGRMWISTSSIHPDTWISRLKWSVRCVSWMVPFLSSAGGCARIPSVVLKFALCSVGGVQSQTITVDRQMRRYNVPRICFINKLDRVGAKPWSVIDQMRTKLRLNCGAVQYPIGLEDGHQGVIDIINNRAYYFDGIKGNTIDTNCNDSSLWHRVCSS